MMIVDLYSEKYTGELETILIEKDSSDQTVYELKLFSADFNVIIDWIPFDASSNHDSLVYILNVDLDWGEEFSQVYRLQEFYNQLLSISDKVDPLDLPILNAIQQICESTIQNGNRLYIKIE